MLTERVYLFFRILKTQIIGMISLWSYLRNPETSINLKCPFKYWFKFLDFITQMIKLLSTRNENLSAQSFMYTDTYTKNFKEFCERI